MRDELFIILGDKRYKVNNSWAKFKHNESFGLISDVSIDSNNNVYVFQRTNPPLLVFNPIGELINCWGHGTFSDAHGIYLNKDDLVMLVDRDAHEIVTCDKDGKILFRMGKRNFLILILHLIIPPILLNLQMVIFMFQMDMEIQMSIVFHLMEHISFLGITRDQDQGNLQLLMQFGLII